MDNIAQLFTTLALFDTLSDDPDEGHSKFKEFLPLVLCGCMGSGQTQQVATTPPTGAAATQPTYVVDNSNQLLTILALSAFMRRRPHSRDEH